MKNILSLLVILCAPLAATAQYFELTPQGLVNTNERAKKYIVEDAPGSTQKQLYDKVDQYLQSIYGPTGDIVRIPDQQITLTGTHGIEALAGLFKRPYTLKYTITLRFKDDRVRIDCPIIDDIISDDEQIRLYPTLPQKDKDGYFIFAAGGKIKNASGKDSIEKFFNSFANEIAGSLKKASGNSVQDEDDW